MPAAYECRFKIYENVIICLSDGGAKYGLAEWRNGRRRTRLLLYGQLEGPPRAGEEGVLDTGRIILVSEKLQAFNVRGNHDERCRFFNMKARVASITLFFCFFS